MEDGHLLFTDLNKQLHGADSVRVTDDLFFEVRQETDSSPDMYKYRNKKLIPIF
jgi:hypothetical protein